MRQEIIEKTDGFIRENLMKIATYEGHSKRQAEYRIEHSYRVAYIAAEIARAEGFDEELAFVGGLLHDIGYTREYTRKEDFMNHGRDGAAIARPFLLELGYSDAETEEICYGIAIHVDDKADFEGQRTPLALTIGDADNIDRFDAFRLYEGLQNADYMNLSLEDQRAMVDKYLKRLPELMELPYGTETGKRLWQEKVRYMIGFYEKLKNQIEHSGWIET